MILAPLLLLPALLAQPALSDGRQQADPCAASATSTVEMNACLTTRLGDERRRLGRYLGFVKRSMDGDPETLRKFETAQRTWESFVTQDCDAVYSHWRDGSIRTAMNLGCLTDAVVLRTHDLWDRYLKFQDDTPPVLPEPRGGLLSRAEKDAPIIVANTPARVSWKMIAANDPLNLASARRQLPKGIAWAVAPLTWDVLPTSYGADGTSKGPFKLATMNASSAPIRAEIKNASPNRVAVTLRRSRSGVPMYDNTFTMARERSLAQIVSANDGESILELIRVVQSEAEAVAECTSSAAVSPDNRYVVVEQGIVDLFERELRKFPVNFPQFGQVVAWSKNGRYLVLNTVAGLIVMTRR
jgi:uncharacterized protein YecT (DUF1311 family)